MIDERRDELPTGLAKELLEACRAGQDEKPKMYRVALTIVSSVGFVDTRDDELTAEMKLQTATWKPIVECVNREVCQRMNKCTSDLLKEGVMCEAWLKLDLPHAFHPSAGSDGEVWILHSIAQYVPKRGRRSQELFLHST